jgi:hypothetical protein
VASGVFAFLDGMSPVWIGHQGELFVMSYQFVDEHFTVLIVAVVIACAIDEKKVAL